MMEDNSESGSSSDTSADENINKMENRKRSRPKQKRTRGPTKLKKLEGKGPFPLAWDNPGCPTGEFATKFASYCGRKVRSQVKITFDDWDKDVDVGLKNLLWEVIAKKYQIHERHKAYVLCSCGSKWKDFKGKLTPKYIRNKHPKYDSPADYYNFIEPADWEKFKKSRETEEFKEKSRKASESRKQSEHPHLMGRRGYNQRVAEWVAESSTSSSSPKSVSDLFLDRSWRWIKGRTKSDGKVPNKKTQEVVEEMTEWNKKVASGEFVPNRYDDVLSRSLGKKEHSGRVRGFSARVTIKDVFGTSHRTSQRPNGISDQEVAEITQRIQKETQENFSHLIHKEVTGILKKLGLKLPDDYDEYQSSCQSVNPVKIVEWSREVHVTPDPKELKCHQANNCA
ncbi:uncharacterized protein LOC141626236 [Silene latifolia]|uniref:uncharacterized protein LOC141626236 n=1 Tax=Silene latifolia TaxID=37657 RepID=UPI003D779A16